MPVYTHFDVQALSLGHRASDRHSLSFSNWKRRAAAQELKGTIMRRQPKSRLDCYYKACRKGDREAKAVALSYSPVGVLADASEITGLPRDNFEVHEISKAVPAACRDASVFDEPRSS